MTVSKKQTPDSAAESARRSAVTRANARLRSMVPDESERKLYADAVARYADASAMSARVRAEWEAAGCPVEAEGSMRQPIPHPLVKMMADADQLAAKFAVSVGLDPGVRVKPQRQGVGGRPKGATSAPDRPATSEPPRLRVAK